MKNDDFSKGGFGRRKRVSSTCDSQYQLKSDYVLYRYAPGSRQASRRIGGRASEEALQDLDSEVDVEVRAQEVDSKT